MFVCGGGGGGNLNFSMGKLGVKKIKIPNSKKENWLLLFD